jgi:glutamate carboxypeptidase
MTRCASVSPEATLEYLRTQGPAMTELLVDLAALESPTDDPPAVARVLDRVSAELTRSGMVVRRVRGRTTAGLIVARPAERQRSRPLQLLVGHGDTVWPVGTRERMPVVVDGGRISGPGVFDMKAGLVLMIFALRAVREAGWDQPATPVVLVNTDEETGSPESQRHTIRLARRAARAFVLEPAFGPDGHLKTARKAVGSFEIVIRGRAAHAGLNPAAGASAILELSHQIQRLFAMNDPAEGVSVNVGTISGGVRPNVVAPEVRAHVDVRVPTRDALARIDADIRGMCPVNPETTLEIVGGFHAPPLERRPPHRALWHQAQAIGRAIGLDLDEAAVGGASDGNTIGQYTATLDGLGAVGDGAHASHEFVEASLLPARAALVALLLAAPLDAGAAPDATAAREEAR